MSVPISLGMLSTFLFQLIDTYFVGQLGADELAALSFSSTVYFLMIGIFMGLAVGVSILVGGHAGSRDHKKMREVLMVGIIICLGLTSILSSLLIHWLHPIFLVLGASEALLPLISEYMYTLLLGMPLLTFGMMAGANLRANGSIIAPDVVMGVAGGINLILDYALIFGKMGFPEYGIKGAAIATVSSWVFVAVAMLIYLIKDGMLKMSSFKAISTFLTNFKRIFYLGTPVIATQIISPITLMFITYLLAKNSEMAVAAFGVAGRIEMVVMIGVMAVSMAITPFIAQNFGANNKVRIDEAIAFGGRASIYIGIFVSAALLIFGGNLGGIFTEDSNILDHTVTYFYWVSPSYILYGLFVITSSIFNGLQQPMKSLKIMIVKTFVFTLPMTLLGSLVGVKGIFIGLSVSNVFGGIYAAIIMRKDLRSTGSVLANVNLVKEYKEDFIRLIQMIRRK